MKLTKHEDGLVRKPPRPNSPTVTVIYGGEEGGPDVGLVRIVVPGGGGGMPPHRHNGSDIILTPLKGMVHIQKDDEKIEVGVGDLALVTKDELVSLTNSGDEPAELLVAAGPADFVASIREWPEPTGQS